MGRRGLAGLPTHPRPRAADAHGGLALACGQDWVCGRDPQDGERASDGLVQSKGCRQQGGDDAVHAGVFVPCCRAKPATSSPSDAHAALAWGQWCQLVARRLLRPCCTTASSLAIWPCVILTLRRWQVLWLTSEQRARGLATSSTGNHALGFLHACKVAQQQEQVSTADAVASGTSSSAPPQPRIYLPTTASAYKLAKLADAKVGQCKHLRALHCCFGVCGACK